MKNSSVFLAAIIFTVLILISATMLLIAFLFWLTELVNSFIGALLITGAASALAAFIIYTTSLSKQLRTIREDIATIAELSTLASGAYRWLRDILMLWLKR